MKRLKIAANVVLVVWAVAVTLTLVGYNLSPSSPTAATVAESPYALSIELIETERQVSGALKRLEKAVIAEQAGAKSLAETTHSDKIEEGSWTKLATENKEQILRKIELDTSSAGYRYARGRLCDIVIRMSRNKGAGIPVPSDRSIPTLEAAVAQFRQGKAANFVNNETGLSVVFEPKDGATGS